jgi:hypothetical protein
MRLQRDPFSTSADMEIRKKNRWLLHCESCGDVILCDLEDVEQFRRSGWPRHCGETMSVFVETRRPETPTEVMRESPTEVIQRRA